jgi:hypothetical protein
MEESVESGVGNVEACLAAVANRMASELGISPKIQLGFAVVLAISAASLGTAYLGFEHVSEAVASHRNSISEADLARNIDRELIS